MAIKTQHLIRQYRFISSVQQAFPKDNTPFKVKINIKPVSYLDIQNG
jgi:hypothetical protein